MQDFTPARTQSWRLNMSCEPLVLTEEERPVPKGKEVLVRVTHCGVCHSDLHIREGKYNIGGGKTLDLQARGLKLPLTLGHEILGTVEAVGPDVTTVKPGDRRLLHTWIGCGECPLCKSGDENLCAAPQFLGVQARGGFADHVLVRDEEFLVDVDGMDPAVAATYACSGVTVFSAVNKIRPHREGEKIAVFGCGGLGQTALQLLKALGMGPVIAVDPSPEKRRQAEAIGVAATLDPAAPDAAKQLAAFAGGQLAAALDFVGSEDTTTLGINAVRKGGQVIIVGLFGGELRYPLPFIPMRALSVRGSYVGSLKELKEFVALARSVKLPPIPIERRPMSQVNEALHDLEAGKVAGRIVLEAAPA
ncbi:alcohol dehydrogenase [Phreatobacter sp.]|uniref:alcohol dehydrogenase n=1 Tax=Phreatobacter sp. TaxID=1966341 RepID=UPI003F6E75E8